MLKQTILRGYEELKEIRTLRSAAILVNLPTLNIHFNTRLYSTRDTLRRAKNRQGLKVKIVESEEVSPGVVLDYNDTNQVVGVEVLHFSKRTPTLNLGALHDQST